MSSRFPNWAGNGSSKKTKDAVEQTPKAMESLRSPVVRTDVQNPITVGMVDEAVETVLRSRDIKQDVADVLMHNLGRDMAQGVAQAYYSSKAAARSEAVGVARREVVIRYALRDEDIAALNEYVPEFKLRFMSVDEHDHPMAAACRLIDHLLIKARLPHGAVVSDVGGNPMVHIQAGASKVHVCGPIADAKDPMRHKLRAMRAKVLSAETTSPVVASMAKSYLNSDPRFVCSKMAQECHFQSPIITSIHVYDIPLESWPEIMHNKGASILEGCMLFSDKFFDELDGELGVSKARYEIDVRNDEFRMGFKDSPSWWYRHSWSQYMLYGTDQVLKYGDHTYSYKIVERRGDTIFFRMLKIDNEGLRRQRFSTRRTPGVPLVRVNGFELGDGRILGPHNLVRKTYRFPRNLWYEMVAQASEDFERGVMDFNKMYNHYRTVSVRQTINAVLVMGGETVSADELVPLVVHVCLAAAAQSLLGQRVTRALTQSIMDGRMRSAETTFTKLRQAFSGLTRVAITAASWPIRAFAAIVTNASVDDYLAWILDWEPIVDVVTVEAGILMAKGKRTSVDLSRPSVKYLKDMAASTAAFDHFTAVMANPHLVGVLQGVCPQVDVPATPVRKPRSEAVSEVESLPSYQTGTDTAALRASRVAAIREHIDEIHMHNRSVVSTCRKAYAELSIRGVPNVKTLKLRAELYRNPDLWQIVNGVIVQSALGVPVSDFSHAAVYSPRPDSDTGEYVRSVYPVEWKGVGPSGRIEQHVNYTIADSNYCGWVLVTDDLAIHNGPEIISAMELALSLPHEYEVNLHKAPPGSGKTYSIIHSAAADGTDAIMCPVRESILDTRRELIALLPSFPDPKLRVRTVDSYLVNHAIQEKTRNLKVDRLLADECFMTHSGKWYAAAALLGVSEIQAYGDEKQIPHIPRVQASKLHVRIKAQRVKEVWTTRRCPPSAVAAWGSEYDWKVRSLSQNDKSQLVETSDARGIEVPNGCVMMCMYQADKKDLRQRYAYCLSKIKIMTAHESEGKTFKHVWLHRFDNRKRTDNFSLFDQKPHVLVAMSRHTHSFMYVRPAPLGDLVSQWIERSKNPRRVAAAKDQTTVGQSLELF